MQQDTTGVLYAIRCRVCGYRGETRRPDDRHDGEDVLCPRCGAVVELEWDGGVTFEVGQRGLPPGVAGDPLGPHTPHPADKGPAPTAQGLRQLRLRHGRTQVDVAACVGVTERQVQRWEAGQGSMPSASWHLLRRVWGSRFTEDFAPAPGNTRGWDLHRDRRRETIKRGDLVELQPAGASFYLRAIVTAASSGAIRGAGENDGYWAIVTGFAGDEDIGDELGGFHLGERVSFALANVFHVEQRVPRR